MNKDKLDAADVDSPEMLSLMGYSIATESGQIQKGIDLCKKAVMLNPHNCDHYLTLGRIFLFAGQKGNAIKVFRKGLRIRKDARLIDELKKLGIRRAPHFQSLARDHFLNRVAGRLLHALRLH